MPSVYLLIAFSVAARILWRCMIIHINTIKSVLAFMLNHMPARITPFGVQKIPEFRA